jgi:phage terminase small subunit
MNEKQKMFCEEYLANGFDMGAAYLAVYKNVKKRGVAQAAASRILRRPSCKAYIQKRTEEIHNEKTADISEILEYLTSVLRGEEMDQALSNDGKVVALKCAIKDRTKAAELLGKAHVNVSVEIPVFKGEDELDD